MIWQIVFIILCCYSINTINKDSVTKHFQNSFPSFSYHVGLHALVYCIPPNPPFIWVHIFENFVNALAVTRRRTQTYNASQAFTTISNISSIPNIANSTLINKLYQYMKSIGTSESYQNGNLKITIYFAGFLGTIDFLSIKKERASPFASRYENNGTEIDTERWIRILDDYLQRVKYL